MPLSFTYININKDTTATDAKSASFLDSNIATAAHIHNAVNLEIFEKLHGHKLPFPSEIREYIYTLCSPYYVPAKHVEVIVRQRMESLSVRNAEASMSSVVPFNHTSIALAHPKPTDFGMYED